MDEISQLMLVGLTSMAISMAIIPVAMRLAPVLGMLDKPDQRKVHKELIPRVGGIGIVIGLVVPLLLFMGINDLLISVLMGIGILLVVGSWDDAVELGPYVKFASQVLAALSVVFYGGLHVHNFPFLLDVEIPLIVSQVFTTIAIVGVINALNLSDGLDGLAGGEALLSLAAIAYLAISFEDEFATYIAIATVGGIFGFLRFNSHPARVFMGDSGSQVLGFLLAVLVVYLSQVVSTVMSPAIPLFLLGLPVVDAIVVFYMRWRRGDSLMVAAKDHLHHRLLKLGFYHFESVIIIYTVHAVLVGSALIFTFESDLVLLLGYSMFCGLLFAAVACGERCGWDFHGGAGDRQFSLMQKIKANRILSNLPFSLIRNVLVLFLVISGLSAVEVPTDIGIASGLLFLLLLLALVAGYQRILIYRMVLFMALGFAAYLQTYYTPEWILMELRFVYIFYGLLVLTIFAAMRLSSPETFSANPLDYLVVVLVLAISMLTGGGDSSSYIIAVAVQLIILFYAAELHIQTMNNVLNSVLGALFTVLAVFVIRALI